MNKKILQASLIIIAIIFFLIPITVLFSQNQANTYTIFKLFGLLAFTLLSFQIITGSLRNKLAQVFNAQKLFQFHNATGLFTLLFAILHPILFAIALKQPITILFSFAPNPILLGQISLLLMFIIVITALLRKKIARHWRKIHALNYLVFFFAFAHSFLIGTDIKTSTALQSIWLIYFAITIIAIGLKLKKKFNANAIAKN